MNEKLKALIKKVIITSTAALSAATIQISGKTETKYITKSNQSELVIPDFEKKDETPKLILQTPKKGDFTSFVSHRSHRSHSSHQSHYSSYTQPKQEKEKKEPVPKEQNTK